MPGATLEATETAPLVVSSVIPVVHVPDCVIVEFDEVAAAPLTVSFVRTLAMAVEVVPETAVPLSFAGVIAESSLVIVPVAAEGAPIEPPMLLLTPVTVAMTVSLSSSVASTVGSTSNVAVNAPAVMVNVFVASAA